MPRVHKTPLWQITIPDAWTISGPDYFISMFRPDGVGMLRVETSDTVGKYDLLPYARDHSPEGTEFTDVSCGRFRGVTGVRVENGTFWRTWWFLCRGQQLVYAAYECAAKNREVEFSEVEAIVQSFDEPTPKND